jgi:branched-chain amino acid transport system ATP-binding protein
MLEVSGLRAWYGHTQAVFDATFSVADGETVALTGLNGAGKTTTVNAIAGLVRMRGSVRLGAVEIGGETVLHRGRRGVCLLPETRRLFWGMTVRENLIVAAGPRRPVDWDQTFELFPDLEPRIGIRVDRLSGGQQQMVALARTLVSEPRLLLLDEPGHGLAPSVIGDVYRALARFKRADRGIVLVDQSIDRAAEFADRLILVQNGRVVADVATKDHEGLTALRSRTMEAESSEEAFRDA